MDYGGERRQNNEKNYELESKHEDDSFFRFAAYDNARVGGRVWAAETDDGLRAG